MDEEIQSRLDDIALFLTVRTKTHGKEKEEFAALAHVIPFLFVSNLPWCPSQMDEAEGGHWDHSSCHLKLVYVLKQGKTPTSATGRLDVHLA